MSDLRLTLGSATGISLAVYMVGFRYQVWHGLSLDGFNLADKCGFYSSIQVYELYQLSFYQDQDLNHTHITKVTPSPYAPYHRRSSQTEPFSDPPLRMTSPRWTRRLASQPGLRALPPTLIPAEVVARLARISAASGIAGSWVEPAGPRLLSLITRVSSILPRRIVGIGEKGNRYLHEGSARSCLCTGRRWGLGRAGRSLGGRRWGRRGGWRRGR